MMRTHRQINPFYFGSHNSTPGGSLPSFFLCHICGSAYCFHENCLAVECVSPLLWTIADVYVDYPEIPKSI